MTHASSREADTCSTGQEFLPFMKP